MISSRSAAIRAAAIVWLVLWFFPAEATAQWYRTYEEGREALSRGDYVTAEQKLNTSVSEAAEAGVKPGRSVRTYGMRFINFVPDYYLGVLYAQRADRATGSERVTYLRAAEAAFSKVRAAKLGTDRDREFSDLARQLASVQSALAASTTAAPGTDVAPPATQTRAPEPSPQEQPIAPVEQRATGVAPVLPSSRSPQLAGIPGAVPAEVSRTNPPAAVDPSRTLPSPAAPSKRPNPGPARDSRSAAASSDIAQSLPSPLQQGIRAFFTGDYADAARLLRTVTANSSAPPSAHFYLACSYGALALLREDTELAVEARVAWREASRSGLGFVQERRFISPRILQLITTQQP